MAERPNLEAIVRLNLRQGYESDPDVAVQASRGDALIAARYALTLESQLADTQARLEKAEAKIASLRKDLLRVTTIKRADQGSEE